MVNLPSTNQFGRNRSGGGTETDPLEKFPLLDDVAHGLHLHGLQFVDVLERIRFPGLFVLNNPDLGTWWVRMGD